MKYIVLFLLTALSNTAFSADYVIDKQGQHAYVIFKASHLGFSYIVGHFEDFEGGYSYDSNSPQDAKAAVTIRTASLDSDHAERDKHLKGSEYFDAAKYPEITFVSTGFEGTIDGGKLQGNLNLRGVEKLVTLDVTRIGEGEDPWGGYRSGFEGTVTLNAGDYGFPAWIGPVEITLIIEGIRQ